MDGWMDVRVRVRVHVCLPQELLHLNLVSYAPLQQDGIA